MSVTRLYMSPIVIQTQGRARTQRSKAADVILSTGAEGSVTNVIGTEPTGANRGRNKFSWCLVLVTLETAADHDILRNDPQIAPLPFRLGLDRNFSDVTGTRFQQIITAMTDRGISTSGLNRSSTYKDLIDRIGRHQESVFRAEKWRRSIG